VFFLSNNNEQAMLADTNAYVDVVCVSLHNSY
jgi:hypothetical protein